MDLPQLNLNTLDLSREEVFKNSSRVLYNMSHIQNIILEQGQTDLKLSLGKLKKNIHKTKCQLKLVQNWNDKDSKEKLCYIIYGRLLRSGYRTK